MIVRIEFLMLSLLHFYRWVDFTVGRRHLVNTSKYQWSRQGAIQKYPYLYLCQSSLYSLRRTAVSSLSSFSFGPGGIQALSERPTGFLQCFDTVGLVIWPVKIVPDMTCNVFGGTLNLALSISVNKPYRTYASQRHFVNHPVSRQKCQSSFVSICFVGLLYLFGVHHADSLVQGKHCEFLIHIHHG